MVDSPPVLHAASWGPRSLSVQSPGTVSAVNHSMRLSGGARGGIYRSGMPPLEDISARWRQSENAMTGCWPTHRDENAVDQTQTGAWGHICGFFYNESRSLSNSQQPTVPTFPATSPRITASKPLAPVPYTGRVMLSLMPPGPASPRFMMPEIAAQVNVPGAATPTGRKNLRPRYLNHLPPKDRFDHLPPPWGPALTADADNIARRWPTSAG